MGQHTSRIDNYSDFRTCMHTCIPSITINIVVLVLKSFRIKIKFLEDDILLYNVILQNEHLAKKPKEKGFMMLEMGNLFHAN